jgi:exonuclease III/ribonuclease HI
MMGITDAEALPLLRSMVAIADKHGYDSWQLGATLQALDSLLPPMNVHKGAIMNKDDARGNVRPDESYNVNRRAGMAGYFPPAGVHRGLQNEIYVGHAEPDGDCHDRSTMLSITGQEKGHAGLRLRNAIHFSKHYSHYVDPGQGHRKIVMERILRPGAYQDTRSSAVTATVLERPVLVLGPDPRLSAELFLPVDATRPRGAITATQPVLKMWCQYGARGEIIPERCNHYCPGYTNERTLVGLMSKAPSAMCEDGGIAPEAYNLAKLAAGLKSAREALQGAQQGRSKARRLQANRSSAPDGRGRGEPPDPDTTSQQRVEAEQTQHTRPPGRGTAGKGARDQQRRQKRPLQRLYSDSEDEQKHGATRAEQVAQPTPGIAPATRAKRPSRQHPRPRDTARRQPARCRLSPTVEAEAQTAEGPAAKRPRTYMQSTLLHCMQWMQLNQARLTGQPPEPGQPSQNSKQVHGERTQRRPPTHVQQTTRQLDEEPQTAPLAQPVPLPKPLTVLTHNVRGLANETGLRDTADLLAAHNPDVAILTETLLQPAQASTKKGRVRAQLKPYALFHTAAEHGGAGQGVTVAIKKHFVGAARVTRCKVPSAMEGQVIHLTVQNRAGGLAWHVVGVYASPSHTATQRTELYAAVHNVIGAARPKGEAVVVGGDWNATLNAEDRASGTTTGHDKMHRKFFANSGLALPKGARDYSFGSNSRIDDVYYTPGAAALMGECTSSVLPEHGMFDHRAVLAELPGTAIGVLRPPEHGSWERPATTKLKLPLAKDDVERLRDAVIQDKGDEVEEVAGRLRAHLTQDVQPHFQELSRRGADAPRLLTCLGGEDAREVVEELSQRLTNLVGWLQDKALETCTTITTGGKALHCRPRKANKKRRRLVKRHQALKRLLRDMGGATTDRKVLAKHLTDGQERSARTHLRTGTPATATPPRPGSPAPAADSAREALQDEDLSDAHVYEQVKEEATAVRRQVNGIDREHMRHADQVALKKLQRRMDEKPRAAHKAVLAEPQDPSKPRGDLSILKNKQGVVSGDPDWIKRTVEDHYRDFQRAPGGSKTGAYLPQQAPPNFPWEAEGAKDRFHLETLATGRQREPLHERMQDKVMFRECVRTLSSGKAAGPDEVINEIIKILPHSVLDAVHDLFTVMWATGVTPNGWKESNTVLLYKDKGDPDDLKNYRPIALANTMYKLWTRTVACVLNDFAEKHHVLSPMQAGFRTKRRTTDQLQLMIMAMEDARLSAQDIYALLVDFSQAFNMINHDKLLQVMYALGFPTDAIEVVKDLYTGARTRFMTPHGPTGEVPIDRGTLQGDSLSPFLFLVYLEPLLRWLHVGARGYQLGCLEGKEKVENHLSSIAFADDLTALCQTIQDLQVQAQKITAYSDWGDMKVNTTKTVATAALHGEAQRSGRARVQGPYNAKAVSGRLANAVRIQGQPVACQGPDEPFTLLGVTLTMSLDWRHQFKMVVSKVQPRVTRILRSWLAPVQKERMLRTCVRQAIAYAFPVAPYTTHQIHTLDRMLLRATKIALGQRASMSSALAHEDKAAFGMGCHSLLVEYAQINTQSVTRALNDSGVLGEVTRALVPKQIAYAGGASPDLLPKRATHLMRVRQLALMESAGVHLEKCGSACFSLQRAQLTKVAAGMQEAERRRLRCLPLEAIQPLFTLGIGQIQDLLEPGTNRLITTQDLTRTYGGVTAKHRRALLKLTAMLNRAPGERLPGVKDVPNRPDRVQRTLHQGYQSMLAEDQPEEGTQPPAYRSARVEAPMITKFLSREGGKKRTRVPPIPQLAAEILARQTEEGPDGGEAMEQRREEGVERTGDIVEPDEAAKRGQKVKDRGRRKPGRPRRRQDSAKASSKRRSRKKPVPQDKRRWALEKKDGNATSTYKDRWTQAREIEGAADSESGGARSAVQRVYADTWHATRPRARCHVGYTTGQQRHSQRQVEVEWAPQYLEDWGATLYQKLGYVLRSMTPLEHTCKSPSYAAGGEDPCKLCHVQEGALCEYCCKHVGITEAHGICEGCQRCYHTECLKKSDAAPQEGGDWLCPACTTHVERHGYGNLAQADHVQRARIFETTWAPSWEPEEEWREVFGAEIDALAARETGPPADRLQRPDGGLPNLRRQGVRAQDDTRYDKSVGDPLRTKLCIHPDPINPHVDVQPPGKHHIEVRQVEKFGAIHAEGRAKGDPLGYQSAGTRELACVYNPQGQLVGTVTLDRLAVLHRAFERVRVARPELGKQLRTGEFPAELARLLQRYRQSTTVEGAPDKRIKLENHWAVPAGVMGVLRKGLTLTKERFASPLNFDPKADHYWSVHERDQLFGAYWDAHRWRWTGSSEANAEYEHKDMDKAMRWAVHSALSGGTAPVLTLLIHPAWDERSRTAYIKWLKHCPTVTQELLRIPRRYFKFTKPTHWEDAQQLAGHPRWDVSLVLVANAAGFEHFCKVRTPEGRRTFCEQLAMALNTLQLQQRATATTVDSWWKLENSWRPNEAEARASLRRCAEPLGMGCPKALRKAKRDGSAEVQWNEAMAVLPTHEQLRGMYPATQELLLDWRKLAYTDGSRTEVQEPNSNEETIHTGAAVYIPDEDGSGTEGKTVKIKPGPPGYTNTINRAELVAIAEGLQMGRTMIATDSLGSMRNIWRVVTSPQDLREHKHRDLLIHIRDLLQGVDGVVHLYKVKSHTGVVGNELADLGAKAAQQSAHKECMVGANPHATEFWPVARVCSNQEEEGGARHERVTLGDLTGHLQAICHAKPELRLGASNRESMYYKSWAAIAKDAHMGISNKLWTTTKVTAGERKFTLQYRYGQLYTQKMAFRFRHAPNMQCLLCGGQDGGHHALSGCAAMERPVTERHHGAARLLVKAVLQGQYGAGVLMADVGKQSKRTEAGIDDKVGSCIPEALFPPGTDVAAAQKVYKPDALLQVPGQKKGEPPTLHVVEVKYCRDTDRSWQAENAERQHRELMELLRQAGHRVEQTTILLGVGGTIYKDSIDSLTKLGVDKETAKRVMEKVHIYSVKQVYKLLKIRRQKEAVKRKESGEPITWGRKRDADKTTKVPGRKRKTKPAAEAGNRRKRRK